MKNLEFTRSEYQRSLTQIFSFLFLFSLFLFSGCTAEQVSETISNDGFVTNRDANISKGTIEKCNCSYIIQDYTAELPSTSGYEGFLYDVGSFIPCECDPNGCHIFSGCYDEPDCGWTEICYNNLTEMLPQGLQNFNCEVSTFSSFPINFSSLAYENCNGNSEPLTSTITLTIICHNAEASSLCPGQSYVSPSFTMEYDASVPFPFPPVQEIILGGECGCTPIVQP